MLVGHIFASPMPLVRILHGPSFLWTIKSGTRDAAVTVGWDVAHTTVTTRVGLVDESPVEVF